MKLSLLAALGAVFAATGMAAQAAALSDEISAGALKGTYLEAKEGQSLVLIVPGSGPTDRDGNNPQGVNANAYKHLAEQLAARGIGSVRVDKRGMFGSIEAGDPNAVSIETYTEDYHAWIDTIRARTDMRCIYLLGHSEGALMVSAAAAGRSDVCGIILVAGVGRPMGDVLRTQLKENPANAPILEQAFSAIEKLEAGERVDTSKLHPGLAPLFAEQVQGFLISLFNADPLALVRKANVPTLVIQGTNDLQVSVEDAELLAAAAAVSPVIVEGMNHILKKSPQDRAGNFATYAKPDLPVVEEVIDVIEAFVFVER